MVGGLISRRMRELVWDSALSHTPIEIRSIKPKKEQRTHVRQN